MQHWGSLSLRDPVESPARPHRLSSSLTTPPPARCLSTLDSLNVARSPHRGSPSPLAVTPPLTPSAVSSIIGDGGSPSAPDAIAQRHLAAGQTTSSSIVGAGGSLTTPPSSPGLRSTAGSPLLHPRSLPVQLAPLGACASPLGHPSPLGCIVDHRWHHVASEELPPRAPHSRSPAALSRSTSLDELHAGVPAPGLGSGPVVGGIVVSGVHIHTADVASRGLLPPPDEIRRTVSAVGLLAPLGSRDGDGSPESQSDHFSGKNGRAQCLDVSPSGQRHARGVGVHALMDLHTQRQHAEHDRHMVDPLTSSLRETVCHEQSATIPTPHSSPLGDASVHVGECGRLNRCEELGHPSAHPDHPSQVYNSPSPQEGCLRGLDRHSEGSAHPMLDQLYALSAESPAAVPHSHHHRAITPSSENARSRSLSSTASAPEGSPLPAFPGGGSPCGGHASRFLAPLVSFRSASNLSSNATSVATTPSSRRTQGTCSSHSAHPPIAAVPRHSSDGSSEPARDRAVGRSVDHRHDGAARTAELGDATGDEGVDRMRLPPILEGPCSSSTMTPPLTAARGLLTPPLLATSRSTAETGHTKPTDVAEYCVSNPSCLLLERGALLVPNPLKASGQSAILSTSDDDGSTDDTGASFAVLPVGGARVDSDPPAASPTTLSTSETVGQESTATAQQTSDVFEQLRPSSHDVLRFGETAVSNSDMINARTVTSDMFNANAALVTAGSVDCGGVCGVGAEPSVVGSESPAMSAFSFQIGAVPQALLLQTSLKMSMDGSIGRGGNALRESMLRDSLLLPRPTSAALHEDTTSRTDTFTDAEHAAMLRSAAEFRLSLKRSSFDFDDETHEVLGRGASATVRTVTRLSDGAQFAAKEMHACSAATTEGNLPFFQREIRFMIDRCRLNQRASSGQPTDSPQQQQGHQAEEQSALLKPPLALPSADEASFAESQTSTLFGASAQCDLPPPLIPTLTPVRGIDEERSVAMFDGDDTHILQEVQTDANILQTLGFLHCELGTRVLIMERMTGPLSSLPARPPEPILLAVARQMVLGTAQMHAGLGYLHRDIKPGNFLFDATSGAVKMCDFGLACPVEYPDGSNSEFVGSQMYFAPERLRGKAFGYPADVWALGVSIAAIAIGAHPFDSFIEACDYADMSNAVSRYWRLLELLRLDDDDFSQSTMSAAKGISTTSTSFETQDAAKTMIPQGMSSSSRAAAPCAASGNQIEPRPRTLTDAALEEAGLSEGLRAMVRRCLAQLPCDRPTSAALLQDPVWTGAASAREFVEWIGEHRTS